MKKRILLSLLILPSFIPAFNQVVQWTEDFEGVPTVTWVNNDLNSSPISAFSHPDTGWKVMQDFFYLYANAAQSPPPNLVCTSTSYYFPAAAADDWLRTPMMVIPANTYFLWSVRGLRSSATAFVPNGYEIKISTTNTNISSYTTTLYSNPWTPYEWWHRSVDLSAYAGQNISIAIRNNTYDGYMMQVDNLKMIELLNYDMSGIEITTKIGVKQGVAQNITGRLRNYGNQTVTGLTLNYRINGGTVVSQPITGLNLLPLDYYTFSHPTTWTPSATGAALIEVWATSINGNADMLLTNDTASRTIQVYSDMTIKRPLYEEMSSKECGPCATWNAFIHPHIIDNWNANLPIGDISAIYYQMDFPGTPDPSYNADAEARYNYYSGSGIPMHILDGTTDMHATIFDEDWKQPATYQDFSYSETPAFIEMDINTSIVGNTVTATVNVNPLQNIGSSNLKLHIAVTEDHYTDVPGFNGETDFYFVMRKMLPGPNGTSIGPLVQYTPVQVTENYTFNVGNVTAGSFNLWTGLTTRVVAFVQDNVTMEVYQSAVSDLVIGIDEQNQVQTLIYPNPVSDWLNIDFNQDMHEVLITLTNLNGQLVYNQTYSDMNKVLMNIEHLPAGMYFLTILGNGFSQTSKVVKN